MTPEERLGARLRVLRATAGLTQSQVAAAVGMDRTQYAHIEAGRNSVASSRLKALADALGVTAAELVAKVWDEPATAAEPESRLSLFWAFGDHTVRLESVGTPGKCLVRVKCACGDRILWRGGLDARDPLAALSIRSEPALVDAIARHLDNAGERSGAALTTEAFMAALGSGAEALALLDRFADESWQERDGQRV